MQLKIECIHAVDKFLIFSGGVGIAQLLLAGLDGLGRFILYTSLMAILQHKGNLVTHIGTYNRLMNLVHRMQGTSSVLEVHVAAQ